MLTLTRKVDESIVIGDGEEKIEIVVKEIRRNQVRIGIQAPPDLKIFRKELYERSIDDKENRNDSAKIGSPAVLERKL